MTTIRESQEASLKDVALGRGLVTRRDWLPLYSFRKLLDEKVFLSTRAGSWAIVTNQEFRLLYDVYTPKELVDCFALKLVILTKDNALLIARQNELWDQHFYAGPYLHIVHLTQRCNLGCSYCHSSAISMDAPGRDMSLETAERVVHYICNTPTDRITLNFQGGEPTARLDLIEFFSERLTKFCKARRKPLTLTITTNGTLIDSCFLELAKKYNIQITVSIDGPQSVHNLARPFKNSGLGSYASLEEGIQLLTDAGLPRPGAIMVITKETLPQIRGIVDEYISRGYRYIALKPVTKLGNAKGSWNQLGIEFDEWREHYLMIIEYLLNRKDQIIAIESLYDTFLEKMLYGRNTTYVDARNPCGIIYGVVNYDVDGKIYACHEGKRKKEFLIGSVFEEPTEVLFSERSRDLSNTSQLEQYAECQACSYLSYCGGCVAHSYQQKGKIGITPYEDWECKQTMMIMDDIADRLARSDEGLNRLVRYKAISDILRSVS